MSIHRACICLNICVLLVVVLKVGTSVVAVVLMMLLLRLVKVVVLVVVVLALAGPVSGIGGFGISVGGVVVVLKSVVEMFCRVKFDRKDCSPNTSPHATIDFMRRKQTKDRSGIRDVSKKEVKGEDVLLLHALQYW
jgi:hypothetical protein